VAATQSPRRPTGTITATIPIAYQTARTAAATAGADALSLHNHWRHHNAQEVSLSDINQCVDLMHSEQVQCLA
jgi:hypothetical protein